MKSVKMVLDVDLTIVQLHLVLTLKLIAVINQQELTMLILLEKNHSKSLKHFALVLVENYLNLNLLRQILKLLNLSKMKESAVFQLFGLGSMIQPMKAYLYMTAIVKKFFIKIGILENQIMLVVRTVQKYMQQMENGMIVLVISKCHLCVKNQVNHICVVLQI